MAGMNAVSLLSSSGRLGRGPFVLGVLAVYVLSFLSQALLSGQATTRLGLLPFALAQAVLAWEWYALHAKRLRDAGRGVGLALGLALIYALAITLLLLLMATMTASEASSEFTKGGQSLLQMFAIIYIIAVLFGDPQFSLIGFYILGYLLLIFAPFLISIAFSIWVATRPSLPQATPSSP
jgi:uncharacterized membrane protein YhaH (DUF805 family)